jgi:prevent-host-death family protein
MTATASPSIIAQRELRNRSGEILRRVQAGESFVITTRGQRVASLIPLNRPADVPARSTRIPGKPATRHGGWDEIPIVKTSGPSSQEVLDEVRAERLW